ncbi:hypothetical protein KSP40_PGU021667 [Platanthera guangdongensis]|uniref:Endopeptidase S2P n=1 Tax=Platanthera guangdongensis TaxID=2320717 RepID=A0ABR2LLI3_9ASPA
MTFGVAFSLIFLVGITVMLFVEAATAFHPQGWSFVLKAIPFGSYSDTFPLVWDLNISIVDFAVMIFSTVISVIVHELGHAVAAASEGVPIEYTAIFLSVIFPGALVAFDNYQLQALPNISSLRIYCAGIWHNAVFCAVCGLALFLMPFTFHPLYIHGENVMVLGISHSSPLSGYLSRGDVILSIDGENIHTPHQLIEKMVAVDSKLLGGTGSKRKGYCVQNSWLQNSKVAMVLDDNSSCPDGQAAFIGLPCLNFNSYFEINSTHSVGYSDEIKRCLNPQQVVKLSKCGEGWRGDGSLINHCTCSEEESCMSPLLSPGISWFEISYSSPYSSECLQRRRNMSSVDSTPGYASYPCGVDTFVYVGNKQIFAHSIRLSAYRPRPINISWIMDFPAALENMLACTYQVSAALAALNCLPVFFLDGEFILETAFRSIPWLTPRNDARLHEFVLPLGPYFHLLPSPESCTLHTVR